MNKQNFDLDWEYTETTGMHAMAFAEWRPVNLPHDLAITKPRSQNHPTGKSGGYAWSGVVTYRKTFSAPEAWREQSVQLEFEGVYMHAEVQLNGHLLTLHPYGYTSFIVDPAASTVRIVTELEGETPLERGSVELIALIFSFLISVHFFKREQVDLPFTIPICVRYA